MKGSNIYTFTATNTLVNGIVMTETITVRFTVTGKTTILFLSIYFVIQLHNYKNIVLMSMRTNNRRRDSKSDYFFLLSERKLRNNLKLLYKLKNRCYVNINDVDVL